MVRIVLVTAALLIPVVAAQAKEKVDKRAPDAVRCVSVGVTGSLVKKHRVCKTNAEWAVHSESDKRDAKDFIERHRAGMVSN